MRKEEAISIKKLTFKKMFGTREILRAKPENPGF